MTYQETLNYMFNQLPMFHRVGKSAYKANLDSTLALDRHFNHPHKQFKSIHVAGTNGKGSTSHMIASILQEAGLKVGLYTSPHLRDFRERIKINGVEIPEDYVVRFIANNQQIFEEIKPSFFEMTVALAFQFFAEEKVDVAVVEVGMGGRLDSTNIISPLLSIITNIGFDHVEFLGDTLEKIAYEKGGVIKPGVPVVVGETNSVTKPVFEELSARTNSPVVFADLAYSVLRSSIMPEGTQEFTVADASGKLIFDNLAVDLQGDYQKKNILTVLAAVNLLKEHYPQITEHVLRNGLRKSALRTGLMGRWYTLSRQPLTICDTGHNVDGIRFIVEQLANTPHERLYWVFGMVSDKDISSVIQMLPQDAYYIFTQANLPRAMDADLLAERCQAIGLRGEVEKSVSKALEVAKKLASDKDLIFIGGSTFVVAEVV